MSKIKHTPGPWVAIEHKAVSNNDYIQILAGSWDIAHNRFSARDWEEERANARLIAASPDLLEALRNLLGGCELQNMFSVDHPDIVAAHIAIAKAETP
jgi:hypothetical protein